MSFKQESFNPLERGNSNQILAAVTAGDGNVFSTCFNPLERGNSNQI